MRTRHLAIYVHDGASFCPEQLADADDYLDAMARYLAVEIPPIQYHLHPRGSALARCDDGSAGCSVAGTRGNGTLVARIDASSFFLYHEGAHALAAPLGEAPAFLSEGLAVALTPAPPYYRYEGSREIAHVLTSEAWWAQPRPGELYARAGDFVRHLIDRHGIAQVRALYEALDHADDEGAIRATFEAVMGEGLDLALTRYGESPRLPQTIASDAVGVPQCDSVGLALEGALEHVTEVPACAPLGAPRFASRARVTIEAPAEGTYLLEMDAPDVAPALHRCEDAELRMDRAFDLDPADRVLVELREGRHVLAFTPTDDGVAAPITLPWRVTRVEGARSCEGAPLHELTPERPRLLFAGEPRLWPRDGDVGATYLRVTARERGVVTIRSAGGAAVSAGWCEACGACTDAALPGDGEPLPGVVVEAGGSVTARIVAAPSPTASVELVWAPE